MGAMSPELQELHDAALRVRVTGEVVPGPRVTLTTAMTEHRASIRRLELAAVAYAWSLAVDTGEGPTADEVAPLFRMMR